jgi:hypothetical protein
VSTLEERERERDEINAALPDGVELINYGNGLPWQADTIFHGKHAYLRFRHNQGSMTVWDGEAWESDVVLSCVVWPYFDPESDEACGGHAGTLIGYDEVVPFVRRMLEELAPHDTETNPTSSELLARDVEALIAAMKERETGGE